MPVDLSSVDLFRRRGLLIENDHLLILESRTTTSRLWRVPFDQVDRVVVTTKLPVVTIVVILTLLTLPSLLLLLVQDAVATGFAVTIFTVSLLLLLWFVVSGKTLFEITYGQKQRSFTVMARPGRVRRFVDRLALSIDTVQSNRRAALQSGTNG